MTEVKLVSIMMPTYNAEEKIGYAICSVLCQTYSNWELIIVDDGSTDNTESIVASFKDSRITYFKFDENKGRGVARQKCLELCKGDYYTMLDSDDWIFPDKIKNQINIMISNPEISLLSSGMSIVNNDNLIVRKRKPSITKIERAFPFKDLKIPHGPCIFRSEITNGFAYDETFLLAQDIDFIRRISENKNYYVTDDIHYVYSEINSVGIKKIIKSYFYNAKGYLKFSHKYPFRCGFIKPLNEIAKIPYVLLRFILFGNDNVILSRSVPVSKNDLNIFLQNKKIVDDLYLKIFLERK